MEQKNGGLMENEFKNEAIFKSGDNIKIYWPNKSFSECIINSSSQCNKYIDCIFKNKDIITLRYDSNNDSWYEDFSCFKSIIVKIEKI